MRLERFHWVRAVEKFRQQGQAVLQHLALPEQSLDERRRLCLAQPHLRGLRFDWQLMMQRHVGARPKHNHRLERGQTRVASERRRDDRSLKQYNGARPATHLDLQADRSVLRNRPAQHRADIDVKTPHDRSSTIIDGWSPDDQFSLQAQDHLILNGVSTRVAVTFKAGAGIV
jgi:hypothetical protein